MQRLRILIVGLVLAAGSLLALATPASAAGCYGASCTGRDPQAMGCSSGARTLDSFPVGGVLFELRYSPACNAAWTRANGGPANQFFAQIRGSLSQSGYGPAIGTQVTTSSDWTGMYSYGLWVRACYSYYGETGTSTTCTVSH